MKEISLDLIPVIEMYRETKDTDFWHTLPHPDYSHGVDVHFLENEDARGVFEIAAYPCYEHRGSIYTDVTTLLMSKRIDMQETA
ncbi:MAG: hypothetical protein F4Y44_03805 [Chloroflexi bacterium]|nr:hypothetical protein [Chloroflexota bacterium]